MTRVVPFALNIDVKWEIKDFEIRSSNSHGILNISENDREEDIFINDATREDAVEVGMDEVARVITTGSNVCGVPPDSVSDEFKEAFANADLIISKGQGNFETLNETDANIFFILRAKCEDVAEELGVKYLDVVLARNRENWGR